jgi:hypothetical protein
MIHHVFSNVRWLLLTTTISLLLINQYCPPTLGFSWSWSSSSIVTRRSPSQTTTRHIVVVSAKRRKNDKQQQQQDNAWYEEIDQDATPDEIFWSEMERQKAMAAGTPLAGAGGGGGIGTPTSTAAAAAAAIGSTFTSASPSPFYSISSSSSSSSNSISSGSTNFEDPLLTMKMNPILSSSTLGGGSKGISAVPLNEERATEKTLALYAPFMVENNWLNEEYGSMMLLEDVDIEEQNDDIDKQFAEWEKDAGGGAGFGSSVGGSVYGRIEPWDRWNGGTEDDVIEKGRRRDDGLDDDGKEEMVSDDDYDVEQTLVKSEMQNKGK